jgi:hypothetical protein
MKTIHRLLFAILALTLVCPHFAIAAGLSEDAALNLLLRTLTRDHVYAKRISLDCVTFDTEETTRTYFQVAVREKHNAKCAGDPELSPVIDRYRINRASGRIEWNDAVKDTWEPYDRAKIK